MNKRWRLSILVVAVIGGILIARTWHGRAAAVDAPGTTVVAVARVERADLFRQINFPAEFRPYMEVEVHAKVSGYVKQIKVDIGDRVKAGRCWRFWKCRSWATICDHALAAYRRAQADYRDAHLAYTRLRRRQQGSP